MIKISVLMEDRSCSSEYISEHGLSLYVETEHHKLLFDTGQSGKFADNAEKMGIDLHDVDSAFISHGHYDHGGGIKRFIEINDHAKISINRNAFGRYYHGSDRYIGLDKTPQTYGDDDTKGGRCAYSANQFGLGEKPEIRRFVLTDDTCTVDDELSLCTCNGMPEKYLVDSAGLTEKKDGIFVPDRFEHEQYLIIKESGRKIVISGCSHKGILNIMDWLKPDVLVGGFHFMGEDVSSGENERLDKAAEILSSYDTDYYTCHCTGWSQYQYLKERMGGRLHYILTGQVVDI